MPNDNDTTKSDSVKSTDHRRIIELPKGFREIVCLGGSTRFMDEYIRVTRELTLAGKIVISVGMFGHKEGMDMEGPIKSELDKLHLDKIFVCDTFFVVNPLCLTCPLCKNVMVYNPAVMDFTGPQCCGKLISAGTMQGYVGSSTKKEIAYARSLGKVIQSLSPLE